MTRRARVWTFSLGPAKSVAQQLRLVGPLSLLPKDRFDFVYAPSWRALASLPWPPDIAVFHRNFYPFREAHKIADFVRGRGGKTCLDLDDLITEVPASNPSYSFYKQVGAETVELLRRVDFATVTNARIKARCEKHNPNIHVLPNLVDERIWDDAPPARRADDVCSIVFSGAPRHVRDLSRIEPALAHMLAKYGGKARLTFIGCMPEPLRGRPGVVFHDIIWDYRAYARLVRSGGYDLAVVPLEDDPFNACKSDIKFIEFSACAIPGVYSDVGAYHDSVVDGETGVLVPNSVDAWVAALERLIEEPARRRALGDRAAARVRRSWSLRGKSGLWAELYAREASDLSSRAGPALRPFFTYAPYLAYSKLRGRA